jgi:outer membrane receptor protein involved in Fe transport
VNAAFYRHRFGDFIIEESGGDTDLTGNRLPLVPDLVFNWEVAFTPVQDIALRLGLKHVGARALDQLNRFTLEQYALVDGSVSWSPTWLDQVRLTAAAHNVLDKEYLQNGDTSLGESAEIAAPRQLTLSMGLTLD